jgi:DNA-binding MarR family transcriptional regulator
MRLRAAYLGLHRRTNAALAPFGVTADQFVVLTAIAERGGLTQKELARRTGSDPNTMSEILIRLETRELITRNRNPDDGRARSISLTPRGRKMQRSLWKESAPLRAELESLFTSQAMNALASGLEKVAVAMIPPEPRAMGATRRIRSSDHSGKPSNPL